MKLYITSTDYDDFFIVRKIVNYRHIIINKRNCLLITLEEPLLTNKEYYKKNRELVVSQLLITARFIDSEILKSDNFPISIHVFIPTIEIDKVKEFKEMEHVAWAELYNNYQDAIDKRWPKPISFWNKLFKIR